MQPKSRSEENSEFGSVPKATRSLLKVKQQLCETVPRLNYLPRDENVQGRGRRASRILNLDTTWRCGQLHDPTALPPRKRAHGTEFLGGCGLDAVKELSLCLTNETLRHEGVWGCRGINPHFP
jgi:hypothetical protein